MNRTPLAAVAAAVAAAALVAGGCGSSGSSTTTTSTSATAAWANNLCTATTTWQSAVKDSASSLKTTPTKAGLQDAFATAKTATQSYVDSLKGLGKPGTQAGQQAKDAVDKLQSDLQSGVESMQNATTDVSGASAVLSSVSVVSGTLVTMGNQVKSTVTTLKGLDPNDELEQAIRQSDACKPLTD
jgi:hypothetical protein